MMTNFKSLKNILMLLCCPTLPLLADPAVASGLITNYQSPVVVGDSPLGAKHAAIDNDPNLSDEDKAAQKDAVVKDLHDKIKKAANDLKSMDDSSLPGGVTPAHQEVAKLADENNQRLDHYTNLYQSGQISDDQMQAAHVVLDAHHSQMSYLATAQIKKQDASDALAQLHASGVPPAPVDQGKVQAAADSSSPVSAPAPQAASSKGKAQPSWKQQSSGKQQLPSAPGQNFKPQVPQQQQDSRQKGFQGGAAQSPGKGGTKSSKKGAAPAAPQLRDASQG